MFAFGDPCLFMNGLMTKVEMKRGKKRDRNLPKEAKELSLDES